MDGATALNYVRQRHNLPGGDFDRVKRQQNWIRAILAQMRSAGTITNPLALDDALEALSSSLATDDGFTRARMQSLAGSLAKVGPGSMRFLTAPVKGTGTSRDGQSIVLLNTTAGRSLWAALRSDDMQGWIAENRPDLLGSSVR
jgi:anionic cell wall polymer biosynthesis LytR-Cps2A-Psr (LCP) family protein